jgi:hypothetical protein
VNVLVHTASAALVARLALARGLGVRTAMAAGLVFATAPALAESVAWVAGRTDAFLVLATLVALLAAGRWRMSGSRTALAAVGACVACALLAKETALILPLVLAADAADAAHAPDAAAAQARSTGARSPRSRASAPAWVALVVVLAWAGVHRCSSPRPRIRPRSRRRSVLPRWCGRIWRGSRPGLRTRRSCPLVRAGGTGGVGGMAGSRGDGDPVVGARAAPNARRTADRAVVRAAPAGGRGVADRSGCSIRRALAGLPAVGWRWRCPRSRFAFPCAHVR